MRVSKRVPLDFDWPLNRTWHGYVNPIKHMQCEACDGTSYNPPTNELAKQWHSHDEEPDWIVVQSRLGRAKRYNNKAWQYHLTQDEVDALIQGNRIDTSLRRFGFEKNLTCEEVNEWAKTDPFGHDGLNKYICVKARAMRLGIYGLCKFCNDGEIWHSLEIERLYNSFRKVEPPTGDGYQIWNEAYPLTPVFADQHDLAIWCVGNLTLNANQYSTYETWLKILNGENVIIDMLQ